MKKLLFIILISVSTGTFAQKISFSKQIANSSDENTIAIKEQWKSYLTDCVKSYITKNEELLHKYWNDLDVQNKYYSIAMHQISDKIPTCFYGEMVTYDITKLDDEFYRIKTLALLSDSISKGVAANFTLFAKVVNKEVKFHSFLEIEKPNLQSYSTEHIKYLYSEAFPFDKKEAESAEKLYCKLLNDFDVDRNTKITYVVANSLDEANKLIGFDYSIRSSASKDAGYYIQSSNMMFSSQVAHLHELVHSVVQTKYPNAPQLFHEGIATYLGGTNGQEFPFHLKMLKKIANNQENIDFSNFNEWNKIIDDKTNPFYTIGAILIDYAYKIGGQEKVESLFKSNEEVTMTIKKDLGINDIDTFIKNY